MVDRRLKGPHSDIAKSYYTLGFASGLAGTGMYGQAAVIIGILAARDIPVTEETRRRIIGCEDKEQLRVWIFHAALVHSIEELFEQKPELPEGSDAP